MNDMKISDSVKFVGVNDHKIDLFEGQFSVPEGMSYNSYLILDEKIAVMDSVDRNFGEEWLKNIENVLSGKKPDFLVVQHMEMDHSANIAAFMKKYPDSKIVSSKMAFNLMKNMFGTDFSERQIVISEGSKVELGKHVLNFIAAPNVHWPEVMFTYESTEKILFSADGFGKFGALDVPSANDWTDEARRYYFGIVGKFGANVQAVLKKAANLEIQKICPLHGPVLDSNLEKYIQYYDSSNPQKGYNITKGGSNSISPNALPAAIEWMKQHPEFGKARAADMLKWQKEHPEEALQMRRENQKKAANARKKPVICIETGEIFESASAAARKIPKTSQSKICLVCQGNRKTAEPCKIDASAVLNS